MRHTRCGKLRYTARLVIPLESFGHRLNIHPAVNKRTRNRKRSRRRRPHFVRTQVAPRPRSSLAKRPAPRASCAPRVLRTARPAPRASFLRDAAWDSNHLDAGHGRLLCTRMHSLSAARRVPRKLVRGQDAQVVQVGKVRRWQGAQVGNKRKLVCGLMLAL